MAETDGDRQEARGLEALRALAVQEAALLAAHAEQLHACALLSERLEGLTGLDRFLVIDVAATLGVGQLGATNRLADATRLVEVLPLTLAALKTGRVLVPQARLVLTGTRACTEQVAGAVDSRVWAGLTDQQVSGWTGARLRHRVTRLVLTVEAELEGELTAQREARARRRRSVSVHREADGMAGLTALAPAEQLQGFALGLEQLVHRQAAHDQHTGLVRTADQRRVDVLMSLPALALHALDGTLPALALTAPLAVPLVAPSARGEAGPGGDERPSAPAAPVPAAGPAQLCGIGHPSVVLNVHVPVLTLLDQSEAPGTLDGYGPISAAQVRRLLPSAALRQVLVDERTGEPQYAGPLLRPGTTVTTSGSTARQPRNPRLIEDARTAGRGDRAGRKRRRPGRDTQMPAPPMDAPLPVELTDTWSDPVPTQRQPAGPAHEPPAQPAAVPRTDAVLAPPDAPRAAASHAVPAAPSDTTVRARVLGLVPEQPVTVVHHVEPQHDPSEPLARFVRLRDPSCGGPGCATTSRHSDLDHLIPWPEGPTAAWNLHPLSRRCHRAKTFTWTLTRHPDGTTTWHSPTSRHYLVPAPWQPPPAPRPRQPAQVAAQHADHDLTDHDLPEPDAFLAQVADLVPAHRAAVLATRTGPAPLPCPF